MGVVFMHVMFPGNTGMFFRTLFAFAVPFFCLVSGYYAYGKDEKVISGRMKKLSVLLLQALILYGICTAVFEKDGLHKIYASFSLKGICKAVLFCYIPFAVRLWYLIGMVETYLVWMAAVHHKKQNTLLRMMPVLFVLQVVTVTLCESTGVSWFWKISFLTRCLPWFLAGYAVHDMKEEKINRMNNSTLLCICVIGSLISLCPLLTGCPINFSCVGHIPTAVSLLLLSVKNRDRCFSESLEHIGSQLSLHVYILHTPLNQILGWIAERMAFSASSVLLWTRPFIVLLLTLGVSEITERKGKEYGIRK